MEGSFKPRKVIEWIFWDMDGTLYNPTSSLREAVKKAIYEVVAEKKGIKEYDAAILFEAEREKRVGDIETFDYIGLKPIDYADVGKRVQWDNYLSHDSRLVSMFENEISGYRHLIVTNNSSPATWSICKTLGLGSEIFEGAITLESLEEGEYKPNPGSWKRAIGYSGMEGKENRILAIGNSEIKDILLARNLGMRTARVCWSSDIEEIESAADYKLMSVYDVSKIIRGEKIPGKPLESFGTEK